MKTDPLLITVPETGFGTSNYMHSPRTEILKVWKLSRNRRGALSGTKCSFITWLKKDTPRRLWHTFPSATHQSGLICMWNAVNGAGLRLSARSEMIRPSWSTFIKTFFPVNSPHLCPQTVSWGRKLRIRWFQGSWIRLLARWNSVFLHSLVMILLIPYFIPLSSVLLGFYCLQPHNPNLYC